MLSAVLYCLSCSVWILQCIHDCLLFNVKTLKAVIRLDTVCYVWYVYTCGLYKNAEPSLFVYMHKGKTFKGESFCEFRCFVGIYSRKSSLQNLGAWRSLVQQNEQSTTKVSLVFPAMWYAQDGQTDICKVLLSIINCTDLISIYSSYIPPIDHKAWTS